MAYKVLAAGQAPAFFKIISAGAPKGGKTRFAMDGGTFTIKKDGTISGNGEMWPDAIFVNAEGGVSAYEEPFEGLFRVVHTASIQDLDAIVNDIKNGKLKCGTLVIDTWTTFRNVVRDAEEAKNHGTLEAREFGRINRVMTRIQNNLGNMPCHVILVVHEADVVELNKGTSAARKAGVTVDNMKLDANKNLSQWADVILWFQPKRNNAPARALVVGARAMHLGEDENGMVENPGWRKTFKAIAERWQARAAEKGSAPAIDYVKAEKEAGPMLDASAQPEKASKPNADPGVLNFTNKVAISRWYNGCLEDGWTKENIMRALGVEKLTDLQTMTFAEADAILKDAPRTEAVPEVENAAQEE